MDQAFVGRFCRFVGYLRVKWFCHYFRKLTLEDRAWVDAIFKADDTLLPCAHFVSMYLAQEAYTGIVYRQYCGCVVQVPWIKDGVLQWQYPIGAYENRKRAITKVLKIYSHQCRNVAFHNVPESAIKDLQKQFGECGVSVEEERDGACYVLDLEEQIALPGGKFRNKRKKIQRFHKNHHLTSEPINDNNMEECLQVNKVWLEDHRGEGIDSEQTMLDVLLRELKELKLDGVLF